MVRPLREYREGVCEERVCVTTINTCKYSPSTYYWQAYSTFAKNSNPKTVTTFKITDLGFHNNLFRITPI